jgi:hypothetical protein
VRKLLALFIVLAALAIAPAAQALTAPMLAAVKNIGGSWCTSGCQFVTSDRSVAGYPTTAVGVGTPLLDLYAIYYSYPSGNRLIAMQPTRNAYANREETHNWYFWARKPCVGTPGYNFSEVHSMPRIPPAWANMDTPWWVGTLTILSGCHPADAAEGQAP